METLLRQAIAAYEQGDFAETLNWCQQAEQQPYEDPGQIAMIQAAALARLQQWREAELHYRRCLDDDLIPADRLARAWHDWAVCIVRQSNGIDGPRLREAIDGLRYSLQWADAVGPEFREQVRQDLQRTKWLWRQAVLKSGQKPTPNDPPVANTTKPNDPSTAPPNDDAPMPPDSPHRPRPTPMAAQVGGKSDAPPENTDTPVQTSQPWGPPRSSSMPVIDNSGVTKPMPLQDTREYLRRVQQRLLHTRQAEIRERRDQRIAELPYW